MPISNDELKRLWGNRLQPPESKPKAKGLAGAAVTKVIEQGKPYSGKAVAKVDSETQQDS